jgi:hypothetical protein
MRYEIQWFPHGTEYQEELLYKATINQPDARDVDTVPYTNKYGSSKKTDKTEAVQFTVSGGYPTAHIVMMGVNKFLMAKTRTKEPQGLSIRAISTIERKRKITAKPKTRKCKCK